MLEVKIHLYRLDELSETARERAISEHRDFMLSILQPDFIDGVPDWDNPEKVEMYHQEYEYIENNDEPVIESIEANDYFYYSNGGICSVCTYTGGPKKGITEITVHGETITIKGEN